MNKNCESCNAVGSALSLKSSSIGELCNDCYNDYLGYFVEEAKGGMRKSFFIFLLSNVFFLILWFTGAFVAEDISDGMFILVIYTGVFGVIGGINLVKSGFQPVGKAELRKHLYEGEVDSNGRVQLRNSGSYDTYSSEQWMTIAMNAIIFAAGFAITVVAGSIVYLINLTSYKTKVKEYNELLQSKGIDFKTHTNPVKTIKKYKGPLAQKCIYFEAGYSTRFKGIEMDHIGYLVHEDELFGAIGTRDESQNVFEAGLAYFIRLNPKNDKFEYIDNPSLLYETLYERLWGEEGSPETSVSTKDFNLRDYTSRLSKKALDLSGTETSFIHGEEVNHGGYLVHDNELYGVVMTEDEQQDEFQANCLYFIKVDKSTEDYDVVDINLDLYTTLFDRFKTL